MSISERESLRVTTAVQRLEPVAGCGSTLDALHQTVVWAWSHAKSRMLAVWGIADIGHHQPGWRGATDRFPVNWTGGFDPEGTFAVLISPP